ncbi:MAG TPA: prepilin-type N-terminal cleavage/methylation domain-containing protein [Burkholderiales bacterium]|nr:prepilin-type N-terminal cleavage/methylation domain-containing protein [Burkholderiales bacterium]
MRRSEPQSGVTLIEMIVAMVVVGIVVAATIFFAYPLRQAVDTAARAALTDVADNALQRIGREVRLALPNSVRVTTSASSSFLEFIPVRAGGRYRAESSGAACGAGTDELAFDAVDTCFKTIGALPVQDVAAIAASDFLVLNNYGFPGQDAYQTAPPLNRRQIISVTNEGSPVAREVVAFASAGAFDRSLHDSPARRFYIVVGNAATGLPAPVTYECSPPTLIRRSGYTLTATQPTSFGDGTSALVADNVESCSFDYAANGIAAQVGLLTLHLQLAKTVSSGVPERISLYHAVHVNNVP